MYLGLKDCKAFIAGASKGLGKAVPRHWPTKVPASSSALAIRKRSNGLHPNATQPVSPPPMFPFLPR
jgi:hypothetical protein